MRVFQDQFREDQGFYYLDVMVPEHERKNVDVLVQKDKLVISAQRGFENRAENGDNVINSNSYESFRKEIPFKARVHDKLVTKDYANGVLSVKIPKKT